MIIEDDESIQGDDLTVTNKRVDEADVAKELSEVESEEAKQGDKEDDDEDIGANDEIEEVLLSCNFDKNDPVMVQLVFTKQFKPKLCHNGHVYTIDKVLELSNTIMWKCEQTGSKTKHKCLGRAQSIGYNKPVQVTCEHSHISDPLREEILIVEAKLIQMAIITKDDPRSIVNDILGKANKNAISKMSRPAALAQRIRRIRRNRNSFKSKKIDDLVSIDIPESLRFTKRNAWFYYDDKERILVFTTMSVIYST